jgi:alcohol dehydrogenase class IV
MDALSHCVETFCSTRVNPVADAIALDGLARAYGHVERATQHGSDRAARYEMMLAALEGGLAFQKSLGAVHSLSHPLGAHPKRPHHGTLNAIFLPHVLRYNYDACAAKMHVMAHRLGLQRGTDLPDAIHELNGRLSLPARLSELGLTSSDLEALDEKALGDHCTPTNPRSPTAQDLRALYFQAL